MDVVDVIGDFGRYQKEVFVVLLLRSVICSFTFHLIHVSTTNLEHWCKPPAGFDNLTQSEWKQCCLPKFGGRCQRYEGSNIDELDNTTLVNCHEWDYEGDRHSSLKSEFNLVCDRKWLVSQMYAVFFFSTMLSYMVSGYVTDRLGRKAAILLGCVGLLITNTALYFVPSFTWFLVIRFLTGLFYTFLQSGSITLFMEIVGQKSRSKISFITGASWSFFNAVFLGLSMLTSGWRTLALISSFPVVLPYLVLSWRFLTESPRWLIAKGKCERTKEVLLVATRKNGIVIHDLDSVVEALRLKAQVPNDEKNTEGIMAFFKEKRLLCFTLLFILSNAVNAVTSHGFIITLRALGGNFNTNFLISCVAAFIMSCMNAYILSLMNNRRCLLTICFAVSGALYLLTTAFGKDLQWFRIGFAMVARMINGLIFQTLYLFENEMYPTKMRARGFTLCNVAGRAGAFLSSFIDLLSQVHGPNAPYFLFGGISLLTGVVYIFVPDIDNRHLPDSFSETKKNMDIVKRQEETDGNVRYSSLLTGPPIVQNKL